MILLYFTFFSAFLGILFSLVLFYKIKRQLVHSEKVKEIAKLIRDGALTFLRKEYQIIIWFVLVIFGLLSYFINWQTAISFLLGVLFSALAGQIGMRAATHGNSRTVMATKKSVGQGLKVAFASGSIMGFSVVSLGILGISLLYFIFKDVQIIYGFGLGASLIALFARVDGGIYTKAADIGADLVGKVEQGIPEDDPRNPAVIADNVGDNVGDVAGMGSDLFESYVNSIISAMLLGTGAVILFGRFSTILPLALAAIGNIACLFGYWVIKLSKKGKLQAILNRGIFISASITLIGAGLLTYYFIEHPFRIFLALVTGLIAGVLIGLITEYYTSADYRPTKQLAKSSQTGAATNLISGLSLGMASTVLPILIICGTIALAHHLVGLYGIALAAVGMLSTLAITLATDSYGPVADNAAGLAEMAKLGPEVRQRCEQLDSVGNTTAAIGKGFAVGSAALTALILLVNYAQIVHLQVLDLLQIKVIIGVFIGGCLPFLFSSITMLAVGKSAFSVIKEVRRQFKEIVGLKEGNAKPDSQRCVTLVTKSALKEMVIPGGLIILIPLIIGFLIGKEALGGLLVGAIVTGFLLAVMMANSGGAWDNAKKYIEAGNFGGKGSLSHQAAVVGDTVGDPFKDTSGPSLNILIKLIAIVSLIIAPLL